jgi:hypothetical protein
LVVIVGELSQRKPERPIILLVEYIGSEVLFQNCIVTFCLAICCWVECSAKS